jgi:hypothetical protein
MVIIKETENEPGVVIHACNPSTREAEIWRIVVQGLPGQK